MPQSKSKTMTKPIVSSAPPLKSSTPAANQSENSTIIYDANAAATQGKIPAPLSHIPATTADGQQVSQNQAAEYEFVPISGVKKVAVHFQDLSERPGSILQPSNDADKQTQNIDQRISPTEDCASPSPTTGKSSGSKKGKKAAKAAAAAAAAAARTASANAAAAAVAAAVASKPVLPHPLTYYETSDHESMLLKVANNFRVQYMSLYPDRKPLLLSPENDVGVKKLVITTLQPTLLPIAEMYYWDGAARFVSSYIALDVLQPPYELPEVVRSPQTVIDTHSGNSFEMSVLLASLLIGAGYDAYVVSGYASKPMCRGDESLQRCPLLLKKVTDDVPKENAPAADGLTTDEKTVEDVGKSPTVDQQQVAAEETSATPEPAAQQTQPPSNEVPVETAQQPSSENPEQPNDTAGGEPPPPSPSSTNTTAAGEQVANPPPTTTDGQQPSAAAADEQRASQQQAAAQPPAENADASQPPQQAAPAGPVLPVVEMDATGPEIEWTTQSYVLRPKRDLISDFTLNIIQRGLLFKYDETSNNQVDKQQASNSTGGGGTVDVYTAASVNGYEAGLPHTTFPTAPDEVENDPFFGMRIHSWVLIRAGRRAVPLDFFVEPSTGRAHRTNYRNYHGVESLWNHRNYYINMQPCAEGLRDISFNLDDVSLWEKLFVDDEAAKNSSSTARASAGNDADGTDEEHEREKAAEGGAEHGETKPPGLQQRGLDGNADGGVDPPRPNTIWTGVPEQNIDGNEWREQNAERQRQEIELQQKLALRFIPMPKSWVPKLHIPPESYEMISKQGIKRRQFLGSTLETFGKNTREDGMLTRLVVYHDREKSCVSYVKEIYADREDGLEMRLQNYTRKFIKEFYAPGRRQFALKEHYFVYRDTVEGGDNGNQLPNQEHQQNMVRSWMNQPLIKRAKRVLTFYHHYRDDGLFRVIEMERETLFVFEAREQDFLRTRRCVYSKPLKQLGPRGNMADRSFFQRPIVRIVERFLRDPSIACADDDVAQREFLPQQNMCMLTMHRLENYITASTRTFCFPTEDDVPNESSAFVRMDREVTESYFADARRELPLRMDLFRQMAAQQTQMEKNLNEIRAHEDELNKLLRDRIDSEFKPQVDISLYDIKRHGRCQKAQEDMGRIKATEMAQKEKPEKEIDFLAPFLARYSCGNGTGAGTAGARWPTREEAMKIRAECIKDFQDRMVARANRLQEVYEDYADKMQEKENWYRELQIMGRATRTVDREFEEFRARASTMLQVVESWHVRLQDRAPMRLHELHAKLQDDERLSSINNPARYREYLVQQQMLSGNTNTDAFEDGGGDSAQQQQPLTGGQSKMLLHGKDNKMSSVAHMSSKTGSMKSGEGGGGKHAKFASAALLRKMGGGNTPSLSGQKK